jgi:non-homologous end joining protein Ku
MRGIDYQQVILRGIKDLPQDKLKEIANFILYIRKQTFEPELFDDEFSAEMGIAREKKQTGNQELLHLEEEFAHYQILYPHE